MIATYEDYYVKEKITLRVSEYLSNKNLAIQMLCLDRLPFASLTVNLDEELPSDMAYVDTNNLRTAFDFIIKYNLGELVGFRQSGFCTYPLVKFNMDEVKKYVK